MLITWYIWLWYDTMTKKPGSQLFMAHSWAGQAECRPFCSSLLVSNWAHPKMVSHFLPPYYLRSKIFLFMQVSCNQMCVLDTMNVRTDSAVKVSFPVLKKRTEIWCKGEKEGRDRVGTEFLFSWFEGVRTPCDVILIWYDFIISMYSFDDVSSLTCWGVWNKID